MAAYLEIFYIALTLNVISTLLSTEFFKKYRTYFPCFSSYSVVPQSEAASLTGTNDDKETLPMSRQVTDTAKYKSFLTKYLCVYLLAVMSDWLQGPYVYALYDAYGFSQHDIAVLFVAGFGSSMAFGSFVGGMADKGGRKRYVIIFTIVYGLGCLTKHFNSYWILMIGRLLGGVATSLLFSIFDSWLIKAHSVEGFDKSFISRSFSAAAYGNSIVAIVSGLIANKMASMNEMAKLGGEDSANTSTFHKGGFVNPFDFAFFTLTVCGILASLLWKENYGDIDTALDKSAHGNGSSDESNSTPEFVQTMQKAYRTTMQNNDILTCGLISSMFEGSMYVFVFMWTPTLKNLTEGDVELPFGLIFSTFMVSCMIGSSLFSILIDNHRPEHIAVFVFATSACCMGVINMTNSDTMAFVSMLIFELCVGMYFPIMGTLKSNIVPESQRSAIYNLYRVPLNFIVLVCLLTDLTPKQAFFGNTLMLGCNTALQLKLAKNRTSNSPTPSS